MLNNINETVLIIVIIILIVIVMIYIIKNNKKCQNQIVEKFFNETPQPVNQFDEISNGIFYELWQFDASHNNPAVLLNILKNDLLKLDEFRNQDMKRKQFLINDYVKTNKSYITSVETDLIKNFILFWIQNEIIPRYTLEMTILLVCSVYEQNGLIQGESHQLLLNEKIDAFVYFTMNSLIYLFFIQNITNTNNVTLNLEINNFTFQINMIRRLKLKLISPDINNHYSILNNTPTDYQNSNKLLIQSCQASPPKDASVMSGPTYICEYSLFTETILTFMKQILDNPDNKYPIAFSNVIPNKNPEKIASLDRDYFGNPTNVMSNDILWYVPLSLDPNSQLFKMYSSVGEITKSLETFTDVVSGLSAATLLDGTTASVSISNEANQSSNGTPNPSPSGTPDPSPSGTPYSSPSGTPYSSPSGTPYSSPSNTPGPSPYGTPYSSPSGTPYSSPSNIPYTSPSSTLYSSPSNIPYTSYTNRSSYNPNSQPDPILNSVFATAATLNYESNNPYVSNGKGNITLIDDSGPNNFFLPNIHVRRT